MAAEEVFDATTAWVSDIDPGACKVLARRFPHAPNLGDITRIDWADVPRVDIITGGSPCQDLSTAGRRAGMTDGTRSNLWVAMREAIAELRPRYVVWENVRGALSAHAHSDLESCPGCVGDGGGKPDLRALGRVLGDLAELGLDAEWRGLRASDVGACHQRFRVFVLAERRDAAADSEGNRRHEGWAESARQQGRPDATECGHIPGLTLLPTPRSSDSSGAAAHGTGGMDLRTAIDLLPTPSASVANDGEGPDTWLARRERVKLTANNGNGMGMPLTIAVQLLPTVKASNNDNRSSEWASGPNLGEALGVVPASPRNASLLPTPSVADAMGGHERRGGKRGDELLLKGIATHERFGQYAPAIARQEQAFGYPAPSPTEPGKNGRPRLSGRFAEWMMGAPPGWITDVPGVTRNEALRMAGNGAVRQQAVAALTDMRWFIP